MKRVSLYLCVLLSLCVNLYGWGNKKTHPTLTNKALGVDSNIDDYLNTQLGMDDGITTELCWDFPADIRDRIKWGKADPAKTKTILDWLEAGSSIEDEDGRIWPIRPRHHFYDPIRNSGLNDQTDHPEWAETFNVVNRFLRRI